jgi:hypothetical protein
MSIVIVVPAEIRNEDLPNTSPIGLTFNWLFTFNVYSRCNLRVLTRGNRRTGVYTDIGTQVNVCCREGLGNRSDLGNTYKTQGYK